MILFSVMVSLSFISATGFCDWDTCDWCGSCDVECPDDYNTDNYCIDNEIYYDSHNFYAWNNECVEEIFTHWVSYCENGCEDGACIEDPVCTENLIFSDWSVWEDTTECRSDDTLEQKRIRTEYDENDCGFEEVIHEETRDVNCGDPVCTESIVFTDWSDWKDITKCRSDDTIKQKRTRTEYDENDCGFEDILHRETRERSCEYDDDDCDDDKDDNVEYYEECEFDGSCGEFGFENSQNIDYSNLNTISLGTTSKDSRSYGFLWWLILLIVGILLLIFLILSLTRR